MAEVIEECKALKIPVSDRIDPHIRINTRAKSRFAACKRQKIFDEQHFIIEVGSALLRTDRQKVKTILAHEVLHTCYGCYNHGSRWKSYAGRMNRDLGYEIKTTTTYEELGLTAPERKVHIRYVITCTRCGRQFYRQKKSKLITNIRHYRCQCGGKLTCEKISGTGD